jgi:hypothetical protein
VLVPFGDAEAIGAQISGLLTDDIRRESMGRRAYAASRSMTWAQTAKKYLALFEIARANHRGPAVGQAANASGAPAPDLRFDHLLSMCDDTGLFQHAVHSIPDRAHGYCIDDNARALLLSCLLEAHGEQGLPDQVCARFAAFVQHAWDPDAGRFRNFMSFDRRWLEEVGSEDSHGRALWALGVCAQNDASPSRRRWAAGLFAQALGSVEGFTSPRAWAFTLLGLDAYCATGVDKTAERMRALLAARLRACLATAETADWVWFEEGLSYDNARLPQALILAGRATGSPDQVAAGVRSLAWLISQQSAEAGHFRPVGSDTFGDLRRAPRAFDQQPLEAAATISACLAASQVAGEADWLIEAERAFAWFLGDNDLAAPLVDVVTGSCRDGLHPDRANENRGGESVVSYLLGLTELRAMTRLREPHCAPLIAGARA